LGERFENGLRHRGEFAEDGYRVIAGSEKLLAD
jgi:hypothetical protein